MVNKHELLTAIAADSEDYLRISKSGYSVKVGWNNEKRIIAKCPYEIGDMAQFRQWMIDAERLCDGWNRTASLTPTEASSCTDERMCVGCFTGSGCTNTPPEAQVESGFVVIGKQFRHVNSDAWETLDSRAEYAINSWRGKENYIIRDIYALIPSIEQREG
jgi:hypothetical protein